MSGGVKVDSLYVAVGFEADKKDLAKVEKDVAKFTEKLEKQAVVKVRSSPKTWTERRNEMRQEAAQWRSEQMKRQNIHQRMDAMRVSRWSRAMKKVEKGAGGVKKGFGAGLGMLSGVGGLAALGAGMGAASIIGDQLDFDKQLTALDVSSNGAVGPMDKVREKILAVSKETGVAKEEILAGAAAFTALTGDGAAASASMSTFARIQKATGANMDEIASSAASMTQQLGISADQYEQAFSILVAGGKAGKIELKDMAALMAPLAANFKQFGGSQGTKGLASLGAMFQVTARNFGSAGEASTGLESFMGSVIQHSGKLKKAGVEVFGKDGALKSLPEIVDALAGKGFNETKLIDLLGRKEAFKTFQALRDNRQEMERIAAATEHATDVATDYERVQASASARVSKAWNGVKVAIAEAFSPERVEALSGALVDVIHLATELVGVMSALMNFGSTGDKVVKDLGGATTNAILNGFSFARPEDGPISGAFRQLSNKGLGMDHESPITGAWNTARNILSTGGSGQGDMLNPSYFDPKADAPFYYEPPGGAGGGAVNVTNNVTVNAPPGANGQDVARLVQDAVRQESERTARDIAAAGGQ